MLMLHLILIHKYVSKVNPIKLGVLEHVLTARIFEEKF
jgi:hypothetical protein